MQKLKLLCAAALASGLTAQSNVIPGLDGHLTSIGNLTFWGRRGPALNGEVGMSMRNDMCNTGSVDIPWYAPMNPDHPMFGFLIARVHNDRIEQINLWSYCKHAWYSVNSSGCGPCGIGGGSILGVNCSDAYGAGNNADRSDLGPPEEINPWLGTWDPLGSYFDIGDPTQPGYPAPADGNFSLNYNIFDSVEKRCTVKEQDMLVPGAQYYYALQLVIESEDVANRGDNLAHRGFQPNESGGSWFFTDTAPQQHGTVLSRWTGANINSGQNGNDDGRFFVATKVTDLGGGQWHYEYAIHNVDNHRGGGALTIPIEATATASNFTFRDIDGDALNDWTAQRVGNSIVFQPPQGQSNALEWNTIYNFGFDADIAPTINAVVLDQARPGPGQLSVTVQSETPQATGGSIASVNTLGHGCGGSTVQCDEAFYEFPSFDLQNSTYTLDYDSGTDSYTLVQGQGSWIAPSNGLGFGDDTTSQQSLPFTLAYPGGSTNQLQLCSNGWVVDGTYTGGNNYAPSVGKFLQNTMWAAMWRDLNPSNGGDVYFDANAQRAVVSWVGVPNFSNSGSNTLQLQFWANGDVVAVYQSITVSGDYLTGFGIAGGADPGSIDISASLNGSVSVCQGVTVPNVALTSSARPVIGTTVTLDTDHAPAGTWFGLRILSLSGLPAPADLTSLGMPGCVLTQPLDVVEQFPITGASGQTTFTFPNNPVLSGTTLRTQSATLSPGVNAFGFATSNGLALTLGTL